MLLLCRYFLGPGQQVPQVLALGLSSRKNLCIHPSVAGGEMPGLADGIHTLHCACGAAPQIVHHVSWQVGNSPLQIIRVALHTCTCLTEAMM